MPAFDQKDLQQTFLRLRDLFNDGDYEAMRSLLHSNLTCKMLHHAESITGADEVIQWLTTDKKTLNPQFIPDLNQESTGHLKDGSAQISGPAEWLAEKRKPQDLENIKYILSLTTDRNGRWLLINAFAQIV